MSVRKRTWKTAKGETKEAWVVSFTDASRKARLKTFRRKKDADTFHSSVAVAIKEGRYTPDSQSITVKEAGMLWLKNGEANGLERTTIDQYRWLLSKHIVPFLGSIKLSRLTAPMVVDFRTKLIEGAPAPGQDACKRTPYMVKRVVTALSSILADAQEAGLVAQNVARSLTSRKKKKSKAQQRRKLKVGVDIPTPAEVKLIVSTLPAESRWRAMILTDLFTGLRASELRGLRWEEDVDLNKGEVHVQQRADEYNAMAAPKSEAGDRTIPLPSPVVTELKKWKLRCPKGPLGLAFPNGAGRVETHSNIIVRGWGPAQVAAGVCTVAKDADGKVVLDANGEPVREPKYKGLHSMRHFFASWCINRRKDGGLELPGKVVQERLGHSSIVMTMDTYGHLFPRGDDHEELAAGVQAFFD
jgi:integrase